MTASTRQILVELAEDLAREPARVMRRISVIADMRR
jgi:hypothetical protein